MVSLITSLCPLLCPDDETPVMIHWLIPLVSWIIESSIWICKQISEHFCEPLHGPALEFLLVVDGSCQKNSHLI